MLRRFAHLLTIAALTALPACKGSPPAAASAILPVATAKLDAIVARYEAAKAFAELFLPFLPSAQADRIRAAAAEADAWLARARAALTIAEQVTALRAAEDAVARYSTTAGA